MRFWLLLTTLLVVASAHLSVPKSGDHESARVGGTVRDGLGAAIPGASMQFGNRESHYIVATDSYGTYSAELGPGVYTVDVIKPPFCKGDRAPVSVTTRQQLRIDFILPVNMAPSDSLPNSQKSIGCYKEEQIATLGTKRLWPLVLYGSRERKDSAIIYSGLKLRTREYPHGESVEERYPAIFTYDALTLTADQLVYRPSHRSIVGLRDVSLQGGTKPTQHGSKMVVVFDHDKLEVKITR